jgi:two-component system, NtrC family, response regulator HydG
MIEFIVSDCYYCNKQKQLIGKQHRILIVEDKDLSSIFCRFLTRNGYEVLEAPNRKKALELLNSIKPSLVICECSLDGQSNVSLLGNIRERYPDVPVIMITGLSDRKVEEEVMKMGAYGYKTKPLFPDEILTTIRKALNET